MARTAKFDFDKIVAELDAIANAKTQEAVRKIQESIQDSLSDIEFNKPTRHRGHKDGHSSSPPHAR